MASFHMHSGIFPPRYSQVSSTVTSRFVAVDWMTLSISGECSFLVCLKCPVVCLLSDALLRYVAGWHPRGAFDQRDEGDACVSLGVFLLSFQF